MTLSEPHTQYQSIGLLESEDEGYVHPLFALWTGLAGLLTLSLMVYSVSNVSQAASTHIYHNGSHIFAPTVVFISLDGVVNQDLDLSVTPMLSQMAKEGSRADYMLPSFPTTTFPNHWTLVTGLYPDTHGIISNIFYDSVLNDTFNYKSEGSLDSKWWSGEPIWMTAEKQKVKTGVIMWPGSSVNFAVRPSYSVAYDDFVTMDQKVNQVLDWFDLPMNERPQLIGLYVPEVDKAGHRYGPYANETMDQLRSADGSIGKLLEGIRSRNLTEIINVIVVSDHGMSATSKKRLVFYDDGLTPEELSMIGQVEMSPFLGIRVRPGLNQEDSVNVLYKAFKRLQKNSPYFQVYKKGMMPRRFRFHENRRIPPLLVLPDQGWSLVTHQEYDPNSNQPFSPRGTHGYDNFARESRAIFVARGPDFPKNKKIEPFPNVEVFNVMSRILKLIPTNNNNTLNGLLKFK
ncbi:hypothetical protein CU098_012081 [Rhizopus stolonifer]|uniref:Uncharacterized protein n=1 Tax=Rhizopus stolonifer TaxID=4846 RepID=A0A367KUQ9_RHIST|nr:hypothetical protein CU098_012081 [Rhizopus stolonifer]